MKKLVAVLLLTIAAAMAATAQVPAPAGAFTLEQVLAYPFPDNLVASPTGSSIAVDVQRAWRPQHLSR
jgi:hypothetical protein